MERFSLQILLLESIDHFGTNEYFWSGVKKKKNLNEQIFDSEANCSGIVNVHCMQMILWWACGLFLAMSEMMHHLHHVFALWQWYNYSRNSVIDFCVFIHRQSIRKENIKYDIESKYILKNTRPSIE